MAGFTNAHVPPTASWRVIRLSSGSLRFHGSREALPREFGGYTAKSAIDLETCWITMGAQKGKWRLLESNTAIHSQFLKHLAFKSVDLHYLKQTEDSFVFFFPEYCLLYNQLLFLLLSRQCFSRTRIIIVMIVKGKLGVAKVVASGTST